MKPKNIIYTSILVLFVIVVGFSFYATARFFSENINAAFFPSLDDSRIDSSIVKVDIETYRKIAPRFGINPDNPQ